MIQIIIQAEPTGVPGAEMFWHVGNQWINPDHVVAVVVMPDEDGAPKVELHMQSAPGGIYRGEAAKQLLACVRGEVKDAGTGEPGRSASTHS